MKKYHVVTNIAIDDRELRLRVDGVSHAFPLGAVSGVLVNATQSQRENFELSPSGYGVHWPLVDEDISIDGLLKIRYAPPTKRDKRHPVSSASG